MGEAIRKNWVSAIGVSINENAFTFRVDYHRNEDEVAGEKIGGSVCNYDKVFEIVEKRGIYLYLLNLMARHSVTFLPLFRKQSVA